MEPVEVLFRVGPFGITSTVATTWALMALLAGLSRLLTLHLSDEPGSAQAALEGIVLAIEDAIAQFLPRQVDAVLPFVGTLWLFLATANLVGIVPLLASPTGDLATTSALALLVFLSVHWFGLHSDGALAYFRHYLQPSPLMLPFHVISELSRTIALSVRLFGNIMSLETAALLVLLVAGFLVPVPLLLLHVIEALVQAYIFGMLTLVYIAGGIQSQEASRNPSNGGTP